MAFPIPLPSLPYKWIGVALVALSLVALVYFSVSSYGDARYDAGVQEERAVWEKAAEKERRRLENLQRKADAVLAAQAMKDKAAIERSRKELEDAVEAIPDQEPTDRQRARACFELRARGEAPAVCSPYTAR